MTGLSAKPSTDSSPGCLRRCVGHSGLPPTQLNSNTVDLWLTDISTIPEKLLASYPKYLPAEELERCQRLHRVADQQRGIVTRLMLRWVLSHYADQALSAWQFSLGEHGKPGLAGISSPLEFNLSHSGDIVVCAVCSAGQIGVDVEAMDPQREFQSLAQRFFSPREAAEMCLLPKQQQRQRFYHLWALKESRIKATGEGMTLPLDSFSFGWDDDGQICLQHAAKSPPGHWQHWCLDDLPGYSLALSWLRKSGMPACLRTVRCIPLAHCVCLQSGQA